MTYPSDLCTEIPVQEREGSVSYGWSKKPSNRSYSCDCEPNADERIKACDLSDGLVEFVLCEQRDREHDTADCRSDRSDEADVASAPSELEELVPCELSRLRS